MFHQRRMTQLEETLKLNEEKVYRKLGKRKSKTIMNLREKQKAVYKKEKFVLAYYMNEVLLCIFFS